MKRLAFNLVFLFILSFSVVSLPAAAAAGGVMTLEEFNRWPDRPEYTVFNPFPSKGMNCTWYAHGRMMHLGYCKYTLDSMRHNATTWAETASRGALVKEEPELHSIAYWHGSASYGSSRGHVAVVETIYKDGSILVSHSSNSGPAYGTMIARPGQDRWPTAFIVIPRAKEPSRSFSPGQILQVEASNLHFRLAGVGQPTPLLPRGTLLRVVEHPAGGLYATHPWTTINYFHWWFAETLLDGGMARGWVAEKYLAPAADGNVFPEEDAEPAAESPPDVDPGGGDNSGEGGSLPRDDESGSSPPPEEVFEEDAGGETGVEESERADEDGPQDPDRTAGEEGPAGSRSADGEGEEEWSDDFLPGDLTGSGTVDIRDIAMAMQQVLNLHDLDPDQLRAADFNGDGRVDILDVVLMMRFALGLKAD